MSRVASLFRSKFTPKKTPPRRTQSMSSLDAKDIESEFGLDVGPVKLKLGGNDIAFEDGMWIQDSGSGSGTSHAEVMKLRKQNNALTELNNFLKLQMEILLDMMAESTADLHLHENEISELKSRIKTKRA